MRSGLKLLTILGFLTLINPAQSLADEAVAPPPEDMQHTSTEITTQAAPQQNEASVPLPVLHAGDQLKIYVYGDADLSGDYRIDPRGILTIPLIGEIKAQGINKLDLESKITKALIAGGYYNEPKVTVDVFAMQPFYIMGEVERPGSYEFTADLDVFKAIATAGGYTPRADKDDIIIIRTVDGQKQKFKATEETTIQPGDSIKIEQRFF